MQINRAGVLNFSYIIWYLLYYPLLVLVHYYRSDNNQPRSESIFVGLWYIGTTVSVLHIIRPPTWEYRSLTKFKIIQIMAQSSQYGQMFLVINLAKIFSQHTGASELSKPWLPTLINGIRNASAYLMRCSYLSDPIRGQWTLTNRTKSHNSASCHLLFPCYLSNRYLYVQSSWNAATALPLTKISYSL